MFTVKSLKIDFLFFLEEHDLTRFPLYQNFKTKQILEVECKSLSFEEHYVVDFLDELEILKPF